MQGIVLKLLVATLLSALLTADYLFLPQKVFSLDGQFRDFFFSWRGELPKNESEHIVIVDIDEKSIKSLGQWPWSRSVVSDLLEKISTHHPGIIGLDIIFSEPDRSSPHLIRQWYPRLNVSLPNYDKQLAKTFASTPVVGGYIFHFDQSGTTEPPLLPAVFLAPQKSGLLTPLSLTLNIPLLQDALYSSGFFNNIPDENGMIRKVPLVMAYDGMVFSSLALEMVRIYSGANRVDIVENGMNATLIKFGEFEVPVDRFGQFYVNFRGPKKHYRYISAIDILEGQIDPSLFENKFVLVGTSALGLYDLRSTTYDKNIPGVEIHANTIDNLLSGDYLFSAPNRVLNDILIIWAMMFSTLILLHFVPSWFVAPVASALLLLLTYTFYTLLFEYGLLLSLLFPFATYILALIVSIGVDYFISHKQKEAVKNILSKKVSAGVMHYLLKHQKEELVMPREVDATLFFSDIQGFTGISESLGSPTRLIGLLNSYMTPMVDNIIYHKGTIDKFIGDAIMAYWNAPVPVPNHADEAVSSAIEQLTLLKKINHEIKKSFGIEIRIGIGIHSGIVTAGDMGSEGRSDYTVIGDNVNLASRLEGLTRYYGVDLLISASTKNRLRQSYTIRPIDTVEVKGKSTAVEIFEVIPDSSNMAPDEMDRYLEALQYFQEGRTKEAKVRFMQLNTQTPCRLYAQYLQRCQDDIDHPQKPFCAVLKMTTK